MKDDTLPRPGLAYQMMQWLMFPVLLPLRMSCRHFARLCSERLDRPLTRYERFCMFMHGLLCHVCRPLPGQFETLQHLARCCDGHPHQEPSEPSLSPEARAAIQEALMRESQS